MAASLWEASSGTLPRVPCSGRAQLCRRDHRRRALRACDSWQPEALLLQLRFLAPSVWHSRCRLCKPPVFVDQVFHRPNGPTQVVMCRPVGPKGMGATSSPAGPVPAPAGFVFTNAAEGLRLNLAVYVFRLPAGSNCRVPSTDHHLRLFVIDLRCLERARTSRDAGCGVRFAPGQCLRFGVHSGREDAGHRWGRSSSAFFSRRRE